MDTSQRRRHSRSKLLASASGLLMGAAGLLATSQPAHAVFDRFVLVQPIVVCNDDGTNCSPVNYYHAGTARTLEQASVLPIFLPLSQFNNTALRLSNNGPGDFANTDGGSTDALTINMWFTGPGSIVDCGGVPAIGCAFTPGKRIVIDAQALMDEAAGNGNDPWHRTIAHEMTHNFNLDHVSGAGFEGNLHEVPATIDRSGVWTEIGVDRFLLNAGQVATVLGDAKAQSSADCVGDGGVNIFVLGATGTCLNIFAQGDNDIIIMGFGSGVLQNLQGDGGNDTISVLEGAIVGGNILGGEGNDDMFLGGIAMNNFNGDAGDDTIEVSQTGQVYESVNGGGNNDTIVVGGYVRVNVNGGDGNDSITLTPTATVEGNVDGGAGNDTISVASDPVFIFGGIGDDTIDLLIGGIVTNSIFGDDGDGNEANGDGNDSITVNGGSVGANVSGEGGNDTLNFLAGLIGGNISGGGGDDTFNLSGGTLSGSVLGGNGIDIINQTGATLSANVLGGAGNDRITVNGGTITLNVDGEGENDTINFLAGAIGGSISGSGGNDTLNLNGGLLSGSALGGDGDDTVTLNGSVITGNILGGANNDTLRVLAGGVGSVDGEDGTDSLLFAGGLVNLTSRGGRGADTLTVNPLATLLSDLRGDDQDGNEANDSADTFNLFGGTIGGNVFGEGGADIFNLVGTAITGDLFGNTGNDVITMTGGTVQDILAGADNDTVNIFGGTVRHVRGEDGQDRITTQEPGTVTGDVDGGAGIDIISIGSDPANVFGGLGADIIDILPFGVVTFNVWGDDGDLDELDGDGGDTINLTGGTVGGFVNGEGGADSITLSGTLVTGGLFGAGGNDTFTVTGGTASTVQGQADNDLLFWSGGTITTSIAMGAGTDSVSITGPNAGGTADQSGLALIDGGDDASSGDGQVDTLNLFGVRGPAFGTATLLAPMANWEIINVLSNSLLTLGGASRTIAGEQFNISANSTVFAAGNATFTFGGIIDNDGTIDLRDALARTIISAGGQYRGGPAGTPARLFVDSELGGPGSRSDELRAASAIAATTLFVTDVLGGAGAYNPEGVVVVRTASGGSAAPNFTLNGGPIDKGLFFYDLLFKPATLVNTVVAGVAEDQHVLAGLPDIEVFQLARVPAITQWAWERSASEWRDRTADLREHINGSGAAKPGVEPGVWARVFGAAGSREDQASLTVLGTTYTFDTSYDQDIAGGMAGIDWCSDCAGGPDGAFVFGLMVGISSFNAEFDRGNRTGLATPGPKVDGDAGSIGAYGTYLNGGFFLDALLKADFPELTLTFPTLAPFGLSIASVDGTTWGGTLDAGYRNPINTASYFEFLGTLSYASSDLDNALLGGSTIEFGDNESFRGRLGVGLGGELAKDADVAVTGRIAVSAWHQFEAENSTRILSVGPALTVLDDAGGTYGEVSGQLNVFGTAWGASAFIKADYRFNGDIEEVGATAGVRVPLGQ